MPSSRLLSALGVSAALAMSGCGDDGETALPPDEDLSCVTTADTTDTAGYHRVEAQLRGYVDKFFVGLRLETFNAAKGKWANYFNEGCVQDVPAVHNGALSILGASISRHGIPNGGTTARLLTVPFDENGIAVPVNTIFYGQGCPNFLDPSELCIKFYCDGSSEFAEGTTDSDQIAEMGFWVEPGAPVYPVVSCPPTNN